MYTCMRASAGVAQCVLQQYLETTIMRQNVARVAKLYSAPELQLGVGRGFKLRPKITTFVRVVNLIGNKWPPLTYNSSGNKYPGEQ